MICRQIRFRGDDSFSYWLKNKKKKNEISSVRVYGRGIFLYNDAQ